MKFVVSLAFACLVVGTAVSPLASAQYPVLAAPSYGQVVHDHRHHSQHYAPATTVYYPGSASYAAPQYYAGYAAPAYQYAPTVRYMPVYGAGAVYAQPTAPQSPIYYSTNNYYSGHSGHTHHRWHPGHYLMGHH